MCVNSVGYGEVGSMTYMNFKDKVSLDSFLYSQFPMRYLPTKRRVKKNIVVFVKFTDPIPSGRYVKRSYFLI